MIRNYMVLHFQAALLDAIDDIHGYGIYRQFFGELIFPFMFDYRMKAAKNAKNMFDRLT